MILDSKTKIINNQNYEVKSFTAMYNMSLFLKFSSLVGAGLPEIFATASNLGDLSLVGKAINNVLGSLYVNDPKGLIVLEIMANTKRNGSEINTVTFDQFYSGNMSEMTEALLFSIEVHFKSFLPLKMVAGLVTKSEVVADSVVS